VLVPRDFICIVNKAILSVLYLLLFCFSAVTAAESEDYARENFIGVLLYRIANHIHWANSSAIDSYHLHIVDENSAIADQLENIAKIRKLHGKNIVVSSGSSLEIPENLQLIYLANSKAEYFSRLRQILKNKNVLLVSHNVADDQNIFLNFYDIGKSKIKFRINKANVINQNLGVDPDIILLGGSEVDVATLYRQGQEKLDSAKKQLEKIEEDIKRISTDRAALSQQLSQRQEQLREQSDKLIEAREQVKKLTEQSQHYQSQVEEFSKKLKGSQLKLEQQSLTIAQQKSSISQQESLQSKIEQELQTQQQRINKQQSALDERKQRLDQQKNEIELRSSILEKQQSQINSQYQRINKQKNTILEQEQKIQKQSEEMSHRGKVIADQQTYLFLLSLLVGMAMLVIVLIYRNSRQSRVVNQQLTEQRDLLSRSAIELAKARDIADKANQAKSSFLANMSHELRTPLNAVLGFSEFLASDSDLSEKQLRYINIVNRSGQHLLSMINDVLDISKIEAGMISVDLESINIRELCNDVFSILSAKAETEGLRLKLQIEDEVPDYIVSDSVKLRQILINLLGNSIKFSQKGDVILKVSATGNHEKLQFKVTDQGIGISKEHQSLIFKPFAQVGDSLENRKGTGLGLSISRQYAILMGGDLNVESSPGEGSTFTCALPLRTGVASSAKILPFNRRVVGLEDQCIKRSILVVDDHIESRMLLNNILSSVGFHVEEAANGKIAVDIFGKNKFDLIFMDINMPILDGIEATRQIRQIEGGADVKIVAITANARKEQLQLIQFEEIDDIVFKPFRINQIFEVVGKHINAKFKYERERKAEKISRQTVDLLSICQFSADYIDKLMASARHLDIESFASLLDDVKDSDCYDGLSQLAQDFRFDSIIEILEKAKSLHGRNGIA